MSRVCLFSIPKAMTGEAECLQHNAFESWRRLGSVLDVVLVGDEAGVATAAREFGFVHVPKLKCNSLGTPLISDAFDQARTASTAPWLLYANADIMFFGDLLEAVASLRQWPAARFLAMGQRLESDSSVDIRAWSDSQLSEWSALQKQTCRPASVVCKDYFLFPRHLYRDIPPFAVGRGNWDNWVVYQAHKSGTPVIDLSGRVTAIHQPHGHGHCGNRRLAYVSGLEAKENQRLAGGRHLLMGSHASHFLDPQGQVRRMHWRWLVRAFQDTPRFASLLKNLLAPTPVDSASPPPNPQT